jgi:hypothetical protein
MYSPLSCEAVSIWSIRFKSASADTKPSSVVDKESIPLHFIFIFVKSTLYFFFFHKLTLVGF